MCGSSKFEADRLTVSKLMASMSVGKRQSDSYYVETQLGLGSCWKLPCLETGGCHATQWHLPGLQDWKLPAEQLCQFGSCQPGICYLKASLAAASCSCWQAQLCSRQVNLEAGWQAASRFVVAAPSRFANASSRLRGWQHARRLDGGCQTLQLQL